MAPSTPLEPEGRGASRLPSLATRLLVPLLLMVGGVMAAFAAWALVQRERTIEAEAQRETRAYATALGLALDAAFRDPDRSAVPEIVDRISRQPSVYGVVVYDLDGRRLFGPGAATPDADFATPEEIRNVLGSGVAAEFERTQDEVDVFSVVHPVIDEVGSVVGAFEVLQPLSAVQQEASRTRTRFILNTLVLLAAATALILWLVRRSVSEPLARFTADVRELGRGRLAHRVDAAVTTGELAEVADELNRMAAGLERAHDDLLRSTETRIGLERRLRQSEKMAMVGQLAAGLAHEIGAPLHVIRGRADMLLAPTASSSPERRQLTIIVEQIDRITRIVRNLLDFARQGEARMAPLDLVPVIDNVLELVSLELQRLEVEVVVTGDRTAWVMGDRDQLQQVVLNLVLNASQAMAEVEGRRTLEIRVSAVDQRSGREIRVDVVDSGPGVPREYRERIFEPFFTTKAGSAGTGLGLSVARWILEDHDGGLELGAPDAGGCVLSIRLPAHHGVTDER